jgi:hypothetical protein
MVPQSHTSSHGPAFFALLTFASAGLVLAALFEVLAALPLPSILYVTFGAAVLVPMLVLLWLRFSKKGLIVALIFSALLLALHTIPWNSRKIFLRDLDRIDLGMTVTEVDKIMGGYIKGVGSKWQIPDQTSGRSSLLHDVGSGRSFPTDVDDDGEWKFVDSIVYRHSANDGRFDSDWGVITFRDDRVVSVQFLPD